MTEMDLALDRDRRVIACNYVESTNVAREGAFAYVLPQFGGNMPDRLRVLVRSRGGRWVSKWEDARRLGNFRTRTLPPEHPRYADDRLWPQVYEFWDEERLARMVDALNRHASEQKEPA